MLRQKQIAQVIDIQKATYKPRRGEILREQLPLIKHIPEYASIITGMRRVGKSTLLRQIATSRKYGHVTYLIGCPVRCSEKQRLKSPVELLI